MIELIDSYVGTCDNCGDIFEDGEYSLFGLNSDVAEKMEESNWYVGRDNNEHKGKHYCSDCFKQDDDVDDLIHLDLTRKKTIQPSEKTYPLTAKQISDIWDAGSIYGRRRKNFKNVPDKATYLKEHFNIYIE